MIYTFQILAGDAQTQGLLCTNGNKDRVVILLQRAEGHIHTDFGVQDDVHTSTFDGADFTLQNIQRQTIVRDAVGHHTTSTPLCFVDVNVIAQTSQIITTG